MKVAAILTVSTGRRSAALRGGRTWLVHVLHHHGRRDAHEDQAACGGSESLLAEHQRRFDSTGEERLGKGRILICRGLSNGVFVTRSKIDHVSVVVVWTRILFWIWNFQR